MRENNEWKIDTNSEYFALGGRKFKRKVVNNNETEREMFFAKNAFLFCRNADKIMKTNKMRNAKVPELNGLMYTGTSGFRNPTLGVYIEWWNANEVAFIRNENGEVEALMYKFGGSPLSGANTCHFVHSDGSITKSSVYGKFKMLWSSFMRINQREDANKNDEAFAIEQVVRILRRRNRLNDAFRRVIEKIKTIFSNAAMVNHEYQLVWDARMFGVE